jgi:hypothetical protein
MRRYAANASYAPPCRRYLVNQIRTGILTLHTSFPKQNTTKSQITDTSIHCKDKNSDTGFHSAHQHLQPVFIPPQKKTSNLL